MDALLHYQVRLPGVGLRPGGTLLWDGADAVEADRVARKREAYVIQETWALHPGGSAVTGRVTYALLGDYTGRDLTVTAPVTA